MLCRARVSYGNLYKKDDKRTLKTEYFCKFAPSIQNNTEMKKTILSLILLAITTGISAQKILSNSEVNSQWRQKTINVKNGGQAPNVVTLLRAFYQALPTWVVGEVLKQQEKPAKGTKRNGTTLLYENNEEDELSILIDPKNGYASYSALTDVDQMSCCVWRRSNGHRLFAVSLYEQHDTPQNLLCWYDYDPHTQTMKPERSPLDDYKKPFPLMEIGWTLPEKGSDFIIYEYLPSYPTLKRIYKWDGMNPRFSKIQLEDFEYQWFGDGEWVQASKEGFKDVAFVGLDGEGYPLLCLRKNKEYEDQEHDNMVILGEFKGKMQTVAISDEMHSIKGFFHVKPEQDAPWTEKDIVAYSSDFMNINYFVVMKEGTISYIVTEEPEINEEGERTGWTPKIIGFGSNDESIHIIHASVADHIQVSPKWVPFEFTGKME